MNRLEYGLLPDPVMQRYSVALNSQLKEHIESQTGVLRKMFEYQMGWGDEHGNDVSPLHTSRFHGYLCLLICESISGDYMRAMPASVAVELIYNFIITHEDVQSGSPNRNNRPTVWWLWGPGQAINAGDGLHSLGRLALGKLHEFDIPSDTIIKGLELLDRSCMALCEGQYMDLDFQEKLKIGFSEYLKMAELKAGSLISCAMGLGGLVAGANHGSIEALEKCGKGLGIAYQIRQDIDSLQGVLPGNVPPDNVLNKKKLLPVVHLLEKGDLKTKRTLGSMYFKRLLDLEDFQEIGKILEQHSAFTYSWSKLVAYCDDVIAILDTIEISEWAKESISHICNALKTP